MSTGSADSVIIDINFKLDGLPTTSKPSIPRIDNHFRSVGSDHIYDPIILSIGPYHHENPKLQSMEEFKYIYLKRLLERRNEQSVDRYVNTVAAMEKQARRCYVDPINLDENQFVKLLVLDGIFIIELFRSFFESLRGENDDPTYEDVKFPVQLHHDILLLENQLPFFILIQLFKMTKTDDFVVSDDSVLNLIGLALCFFSCMAPCRLSVSRVGDFQNIDHLFGLFHASLCHSFAETISSGSPLPPHFGYNWENINPVSRLREAGIKFRKANENNLMGIKFVKGELIIPRLTITEERESQFRNLIVYEQYFPKGKPRYVSDYSLFMSCLIKTSNDIDFLSSYGIVSNRLGTDEEVCQMFNRLGRKILISSNFCYAQVFCDVNRHCSRRANRWKANLKRNYFNSPGSLISFSAAAVLLILTLAQTIYTVIAYYYR